MQVCCQTVSSPTRRPESRGSMPGEITLGTWVCMHILTWISKWTLLVRQHAKQQGQWGWSLEVEPTWIDRSNSWSGGWVKWSGEEPFLNCKPVLSSCSSSPTIEAMPSFLIPQCTCFCFLPGGALKAEHRVPRLSAEGTLNPPRNKECLRKSGRLHEMGPSSSSLRPCVF